MRRTLTLVAGMVIGGAAVGLLLVAGLSLFGTGLLCAEGILCDLAGYRNVGAARGIHLVGTADPYRSFAVVWETPSRQRPPSVEYRPAGRGDWSKATGTSQQAPPNGLVASDAHIHRVEVTDLEPGTEYEYRVSWDARSRERSFSPTFVTHTLSREQPIRVAFLSDTCLQLRPDGRSGPMDAIMRDLRSTDIDLILGGGDYACALDDGRYATPEPVVQRFFDEWQPVFSSIPFVAQYGNHESCHGEWPELWDARLDLSWAPEQAADGRSFAFDILDTHIVGLYATGCAETVPEDHVAWLSENLEQARGRGQRHLIVYQHAPLFGEGRAHPPAEAMRRQLVPVLERQQVDLHLSAHDMSYERTQPITNAGGEGAPATAAAGTPEGAWSGVVYAKVSPTGRPTHRDDNVPADVPPYFAVVDDQRYFYATFTIHPGDRPLEYRAYAFDGQGRRSVLDRLTLP